MPIRLAVSQLEYFRVIGCLMYAITCTRPDIAFAVGKLSRQFVYNGLVFLAGGGVISWASKKQTCITGSTMESEFLALATAGKEAEWLKNLLLEIPLWVKPIAPISIHCDSAATLAKAYSHMYSGKSRHLGWQRTEAHVLQIIPRMCLEPADKDIKEMNNFSNVNFFERRICSYRGWRYGVYTQRSLNTLTRIVVKGIHDSDEVLRSLMKFKESPSSEWYFIMWNVTLRGLTIQECCFSIEPSVGMLLSGQADALGH
ncbi:hypothetical protein Tco_1176556 [Tanacetum coccineum]